LVLLTVLLVPALHPCPPLFPYTTLFRSASQQDSGSVVVPNRSDFGRITYREWFSTGAFESGYIAPDFANPNLIYSIGWYGSVLRDRKSTRLNSSHSQSRMPSSA